MRSPIVSALFRGLSLFPVAFVVALVGWSWYVFVFRAAIPNFTLLGTIFSLIALHPLLVLFMWSYYMVVTVHPGKPIQNNTHNSDIVDFQQQTRNSNSNNNHSNNFDEEMMMTTTHLHHLNSNSNSHQNEETADTVLVGFSPWVPLEVKRDGGQRFCNKCQALKPDRSHHCSVCDTCILKMDHHCPWVAGCIGFHNYKFFIQFVFYGTMYCIIVFIGSIVSAVPAFSDDTERKPLFLALDFQVMFVILFSGMFGICLAVFTAMHIGFALTNRTTIESMEGAGYIKINQMVHPLKNVNIYDVSKNENWRQVMGNSIVNWFIPTSKGKGDGHTFNINMETYQKLADTIS